MQKYLILLTLIFATVFGTTACTTKDGLKKMLKENPDILTEAFSENPDKIIGALNDAARKAQAAMAKNQEEEENKQLEESFEKPVEVKIRPDDTFRGPKDAPLTLIVFSDFECPYCSRGYKTEVELMEKYKGKMRILFKHLPLPMHPHAMIAAQYYEGIRLQSPEKAEKFHSKIFTQQAKLQAGESFLKSLAKELGADMAKLAKDVKSDAIISRIKADADEANALGFQGTPGFILNGVPVRGAYPTDYFVELVEKLKAKGKVQL